MDNTIVVALISFAGTFAGTLGGIITSNKLTNYRIEQLEKKVEKHNKVVERVYALEKEEALIEQEIEDLKKFHK